MLLTFCDLLKPPVFLTSPGRAMPFKYFRSLWVWVTVCTCQVGACEPVASRHCTFDCVFMNFYFFDLSFSHEMFKRMSLSVANMSSADEFDV